MTTPTGTAPSPGKKLNRLGLEVTAERPGATFMSKGGYHHHIAVNTWGDRTRPGHDDGGRIGMLWFEIALPGSSSVAALAVEFGAPVTDDRPLVVTDPNALAIRFVAQA